MLHQISQKILRFVRGRFSSTPYSILSAPLSEGGLDCPSLVHRRLAYDAKYVSDLISAPLDSLWKQWGRADLLYASHNGTPDKQRRRPLQPLIQHTNITLKLLEPCLRQAHVSLKALGFNIECAFPSVDARNAMLVSYHPALPMPMPRRAAVLSHFGIRTVEQLVAPLYMSAARRRARGIMSVAALTRAHSIVLQELCLTGWHPEWHLPNCQRLLGGVRIWPSMKGPYGCICILSDNPSIWARHSGLRRFFPSRIRGGRPGFQPGVTEVFPLPPPLLPHRLVRPRWTPQSTYGQTAPPSITGGTTVLPGPLGSPMRAFSTTPRSPVLSLPITSRRSWQS